MGARFQHTAARRRLPVEVVKKVYFTERFNTQPRGGGCLLATGRFRERDWVSTHSRAEAAA